jgi:uncharacterized protein YkwD
VLTAVLAGALVAGAATMVSDPPASSADEGGLSFAISDAPSSDQRNGGGLERGEPGGPSSGAPTTSAPPTSSSTAPPSSTTSAPPPTSETPADPPPADPPPADPDPPPASGSHRDQVVQYVNWARQERGCGPVTVDSRLAAAAQGHAEDMSNRDYFSHTTPEGVTFDQRIRNAGYPSPGAENIAYGATSAEQVMKMWMESDGHRRNILNCDLNAIGVGLETDGWYWVQNFGW